MNSLTELNGFGNTTITYDDNRDPNVLFDKPLPVNQSINKNQAENHTVPIGINIVEIIRPADVGLLYTIDISATSGASLSWASLPSGVSVNTPSAGIYQVTGITTPAVWDIVKSPTYEADVSFVGVFSYTCSITYNGSSTVSWTVDVIVNDIDFLSSNPADFYFNASQSGTVSGNPTVIWTPTANWSVTVTPSQISYVNTLGSAGSGGTSSFNSTTKVLTISGTKTQVNSHLNSISYSLTSTALTDMTLLYFARNQTTLEGDSKVQNWLSTDILSATRATDSYTLNTATTITNGPLFTDTRYDGTGTYTMTVTPTVSAAVSTMSSTGRFSWPGQNINVFNADSSTVSLSAALNSADATYLANGDSGTTGPYGTINIYTRSIGGSAWTRQTTLEPPTMNTIPDCRIGIDVKLNSDGTTLAALGSEQNSLSRAVPTINIWTRSGSSWTHQTRLFGSGLNAINRSLQFNQIALSSNGNTVALSYYDNNSSGTVIGRVYVWTRSGSTWTEQANFTGSDAVAIDSFGQDLVISDSGDVLAVSSKFDNNERGVDAGAVYVFRRSGSTWSQEAKLLGLTSGTNDTVGSNLHMSSDGTKIWATGNSSLRPATTYQWTYSGSWSAATELSYYFSYVNRTGTVARSLLNIMYQYVSSAWVPRNTLTNTPAVSEYLTGSADGNIIVGRSQYQSSSKLVIFGPPQTVGTSWNSGTKTLTLTGTRTEVNTEVDLITLTPASGYTTNIVLTYTGITPRSDIDTRTQTITYTP
jgi:hypothetical protein